MSQSATQFGAVCALVLGVCARSPLPAQTSGTGQERLVHQSPNPAKIKERNAGQKKTASAVQLSQSAAMTAEDVQRELTTPDFDALFIDTPLKDCFEFFRDVTGINFVIDKKALAKERISIDTWVTYDKKPVALARCLDRILEPLGLTWFVRDNLVHVTTKTAAEEVFVTRTYPVGEILAYTKTHRPDKADYYLYFPRMSDGGWSPPIPPETPVWLMSLLESFTSGPWLSMDGTGGSISYVKNHLIVRQSHKVQMEIAQILKGFRDFTKGELKPKAFKVHPPYYARDEDRAVKKALTKIITVTCEKMSLVDFLRELAQKLDVPLSIDEKAWKEEKISTDEAITVELKDMPAKSILEQTLKPLALTALVVDGQLFVTSIIAAEKRLVTTLYDVRDLALSKNRGPMLAEAMQSQTSGPWQDMDGTGGNAEGALADFLVVRQTQTVHDEIANILADLRKEISKQPAVAEKAPPDPKTITTQIYRLDFVSNLPSARQAIVALFEPQSWAGQGGKGNILIVDHTLIVKNKIAVQKEVEAFLSQLRKAEKLPNRGDANLSNSDADGNLIPREVGGANGGFVGGCLFRVPPQPKPKSSQLAD